MTFHELFGGTENREMTYKSGILTIGEYSARKTFKNIYFKYVGPINIKATLDDRVVFNRALKPTNAIQYEEIAIKGGLDGYGLQLEITGSGEVHEVQLKAKRREKP